MKYFSTKNQSPPVNFQTAVFSGLASDGGLYMPETIPHFDFHAEHASTQSLHAQGTEILHTFIGDEIPKSALQQIIGDALSFPMPLKKIGDHYILELFHGPTMAFKDVAAQVLARIIEYFLQQKKQRLTILVATSGDTGGAVAQAFGNKKNINVVILYPAGKVSTVQEEQLTRVSENIYTLALDGTFDDCQALVKQAFPDPELADLNLTTANSINIGRLLPQIIYFAYAATQLSNNKIRFVVPSGNMGNSAAGILAKKMGFPIDQFVIACNANDTVVSYYNSGIFTPKQSVQTLSNAMDIGAPNNFDRILHMYQNDHTAFCKYITAVSVSDDATIETIKEVYTKYGYLLDPHTAVAWKAATLTKDPCRTSIIVATASPVKFAEEIAESTGIYQTPPHTSNFKKIPKRVKPIQNTYKAIKNHLLTIR